MSTEPLLLFQYLLKFLKEFQAMMGKKTKQSPLFYYMNISDMIPENHILRLINKYIDFSFIRKKTKHLYSDTGRPSIDPEVLIKMLLVGYLYGITSDKKIMRRSKYASGIQMVYRFKLR